MDLMQALAFSASYWTALVQKPLHKVLKSFRFKLLYLQNRSFQTCKLTHYFVLKNQFGKSSKKIFSQAEKAKKFANIRVFHIIFGDIMEQRVYPVYLFCLYFERLAVSYMQKQNWWITSGKPLLHKSTRFLFLCWFQLFQVSFGKKIRENKIF